MKPPRLLRRRPPTEPSRPTTSTYHAGQGHRDFFHPIDHELPQGVVDRADELVWVATRIELHAAAGTLDEGTGHILDAQINQRHAQWDDAVAHYAAHRMRTAKALHAEESEHLTRLLQQLHELRLTAGKAHAENEHWRGVLLGGPLTSPPTTTQHLVVAPAAAGLTIADPTSASTTTPWTALAALEPARRAAADDQPDNSSDDSTTGHANHEGDAR